MSKIEYYVYPKEKVKEYLGSYRTNSLHPFYGYEGNSAAIETGMDIVYMAYMHTEVINKMVVCTRRCSARIALIAPMSSGKNEYFRRFTKLLDTPVLEVDGTKLSKAEDVLELCKKNWLAHPLVKEFGFKDWEKIKSPTGSDRYVVPPMSILFDEFHRVKGGVQDGLLKMCENKDGILVVDGIEYDFRGVCIFVATNNPGKIGAAFNSRFTTIQLERPDVEALTKIVNNENKDWEKKECFEIAKICPVARQALDFARLVRGAMERSGESVIKTIEHVRKRSGIFQVGLTKRAAQVLQALSANPHGLSRNTLLASMDNMEEEEFDSNILPQLIPGGNRPALITINNRHKITDAGQEALDCCNKEVLN